MKVCCEWNAILGKLTGVSWPVSRAEESSEDVQTVESHEDGLKIRENTDLESIHENTDSKPDISKFCEAELHAFKVVITLGSSGSGNNGDKNTESKKKKPKDFSSLSIDLPEHCRRPLENLSTNVKEELLPLIEQLIGNFLQISRASTGLSSTGKTVLNTLDSAGSKLKSDTKSPNDGSVAVKLKSQKSSHHNYSQEYMKSTSPSNSNRSNQVELSLSVTFFKSIAQFETQLMMHLVESGPCLLICQVDQALQKMPSDTQGVEQLCNLLESWFWLLLQRTPSISDSHSVLLLVTHTLPMQPTDKTNSNLNLVSQAISAVCSKTEFTGMLVKDPIFISTETEATYSIEMLQSSLLTLVESSPAQQRPQAVHLVPRPWARLSLALLALSSQQTKLLSFGQACRVAASEQQGPSTSEVAATLHYLCSLIGGGLMVSPGPVQTAVLITDRGWLARLIAVIQETREIATEPLQDTLEHVLKPFPHHRLLLLTLLKQYHLLLTDPQQQQSLISVFDFPSAPPPPKPSTKHIPGPDDTNCICLLFRYCQPLPWMGYLSFLFRAAKMVNSMDDCQFEVESCRLEMWLEGSEAGQDAGKEEGCRVQLRWLSAWLVMATVSGEAGHPLSPVTLCRLRQFLEQQQTASLVVRCFCGQPCALHAKKKCTTQIECWHYHRLDELLCSQTVFCHKRRLSTEFWRSMFGPDATRTRVPSLGLPSSTSGGPVIPAGLGSSQQDSTPRWLLLLAKALNGDEAAGFNWHSLAPKLGYKDAARKYKDAVNPGLALVTDWIHTSGNNQLSVEFLTLALQDAGQYSLSDIVEMAPECQQWLRPAQIFISYQWHSQREARLISERLQRAGFSVWMDVGQLGGGDLLLHRIERAVRQCVLLLACVSPRYVLSPICHRELVLASLLRKPLLPVVVSRVPWPPPGGTGLLLAPYVYVDLYGAGAGGHGGCGLAADVSGRLAEITMQVSKHCSPCQMRLAVSDTDITKTVTPYSSRSQLSHSEPSSALPPSPSVVGAPSPVPPSHSVPTTVSQASVRECSSICRIL